MTQLAGQTVLPYFDEIDAQTGIYPAQWYQGAVQRGVIQSVEKIAPEQVQPASLDLRLGETAYLIDASFLPGRACTVQEKLDWLSHEKIDITKGALLKRDHVYIIELQEALDLRKRMSGVGNAKSSTGRLDIFARLIADHAVAFDSVDEQYTGPLWVEVAPKSFDIVVKKGSRLVQLRIKTGSHRNSREELKRLNEQVILVRGTGPREINSKGIDFSVDIIGDTVSKIIGFRAKKNAPEIDVDLVNHYDPDLYWEPVYRPSINGIVLKPDDFHILASKETIVVPNNYAADMIAYDTLVGEFRVHYAGFFDPGFGYSPHGDRAARAVLEVRSHEVPFMIEDGQIVGTLAYERLTEESARPYGSGIGSSYQYQGLALSKQFKRD
jgi:dCTP deaminase